MSDFVFKAPYTQEVPPTHKKRRNTTGEQHGNHPGEIDWELHRPMIESLYSQNTLEDVMAIMAEDYGVFASEKQFKNQLKKWDVSKYMKLSDSQWKYIRQKTIEGAQQGKNTSFHLNHKKLDNAKIQRTLIRKWGREGITTDHAQAETSSAASSHSSTAYAWGPVDASSVPRSQASHHPSRPSTLQESAAGLDFAYDTVPSQMEKAFPSTSRSFQASYGQEETHVPQGFHGIVSWAVSDLENRYPGSIVHVYNFEGRQFLACGNCGTENFEIDPYNPGQSLYEFEMNHLCICSSTHDAITGGGYQTHSDSVRSPAQGVFPGVEFPPGPYPQNSTFGSGSSANQPYPAEHLSLADILEKEYLS